MNVVSDTSCLSALLRVGQLSLLQALFGTIAIPEKVAEELSRLKAFGIDLSEFSNADWIIVKTPKDLLLLEHLLEQLTKAKLMPLPSPLNWLLIGLSLMN